MGTSTTAQLIAKGKAENGYNNSGISSDDKWVDFFNDALRDLVDDLNITKVGTINFTTNTREYNLEDDYYAMVRLIDGGMSGSVVLQRRYYEQSSPDGYWIFYRGSAFVIDLYSYMADRTFTYLYQAYPTALNTSDQNDQKPDVPSVGEKALIYFALQKALRNNSQLDDAKEYERLYEQERIKIRTAAARGGG